MRDQILSNLDDHGQLEKLYRGNKSLFKKDFQKLYPEIKRNSLADFWYERLNYEADEISWGSKNEILFIITACLIAGLLAKFPAIFAISEEYFYSRNIGFLVFPFLTAYFGWKNNISFKKIVVIIAIMLACLVYINILPNNIESDTLILACIHLPLLLWVLFGLSFTGNELKHFKKSLDFLRFNGDVVVMSALLIIAGIIMSGITIGLFNLIGYKIEEFYFEYVVIISLPAIPILATFLTQTNPQLVNKVSPIIAKIFSPLVLIMLLIYLVAIMYSGKDPYNDREFLLIFNLLLIGVMALIFFSAAVRSTNIKSVSGIWVLFALSIVTIIVNTIALSAIIFRISEWGFTPNRVAVFSANVLILIHLSLVTFKLYKVVLKKAPITEVGRYIAQYLPIYFIWTILVIFLFPLLFNFK
mgnify:CR=1 FL=1|tara:strand:+ start:556 stop:1800 length:1245 start_codon:yes stop_codon:yes gene_type:complete